MIVLSKAMVALLLESARLYTNTVPLGVSELTELDETHHRRNYVKCKWPVNGVFGIGSKAQRSEP